MTRLLTITFLITTMTASYGQVNQMDYGATETIYEKAIKELARDFKDNGPIYVADEGFISNFFQTQEVKERKVIFVNELNESNELRKNGNLMRIYQIEYPLVTGDRIQIKINHIVAYEIDLLKSESYWPKKLTENERKLAREGIEKSRLLKGGHEAITYNSVIQNTWTYVIFKFDPLDKEFKTEKVETKSN